MVQLLKRSRYVALIALVLYVGGFVGSWIAWGGPATIDPRPIFAAGISMGNMLIDTGIWPVWISLAGVVILWWSGASWLISDTKNRLAANLAFLFFLSTSLAGLGIFYQIIAGAKRASLPANENNPPSEGLAEQTFIKDGRTVYFVGTHHVAPPSFYRLIEQRIEEKRAEGYDFFFEAARAAISVAPELGIDTIGYGEIPRLSYDAVHQPFHDRWVAKFSGNWSSPEPSVDKMRAALRDGMSLHDTCEQFAQTRDDALFFAIDTLPPGSRVMVIYGSDHLVTVGTRLQEARWTAGPLIITGGPAPVYVPAFCKKFEGR